LPIKVEPIDRIAGIVGDEGLVIGIITIGEGVQGWVPDEASIGMVQHKAHGEIQMRNRMVMVPTVGSDISDPATASYCILIPSPLSILDLPRDRVDRVRAFGRVHHRTLSILLRRVIGEGFPARMLAEPQCLWDAIQETDHIVFPAVHQGQCDIPPTEETTLPVPNMIPKFLAEYRVPLVIPDNHSRIRTRRREEGWVAICSRIKVVIENVHSTVAMVGDDNGTARSPFCLALRIWLYARKPRGLRVCINSLLGGQVDTRPS
jgi:hypothetical protein